MRRNSDIVGHFLHLPRASVALLNLVQQGEPLVNIRDQAGIEQRQFPLTAARIVAHLPDPVSFGVSFGLVHTIAQGCGSNSPRKMYPWVSGQRAQRESPSISCPSTMASQVIGVPGWMP